jgi:hypothetical protein
MINMKLFMLLTLMITTGCAHSIHQVYISGQDPQSAGQGQWVSADSKTLVILGFQSETNYVEEAMRELESKCPDRLALVTTEHLTSYKFLSYEQKVIMKGLCLKTPVSG